MSETIFYILFGLREERHGYGVMQFVKALAEGRIELGAGTMYSTLRKLERQNSSWPPAKSIGARTTRSLSVAGKRSARKPTVSLNVSARKGAAVRIIRAYVQRKDAS